MLRFVFVIIISFPFIIYYMFVESRINRHPDRYDEEKRYKVAKKVVNRLRKNGLIKTQVYGKENLPKEGGYIMYSNHQGKYDAVGIIYGHDKPCTIMMDEKRSHLPIVNQFMRLIKGCRLDKSSIQEQVKSIKHITEEVKQGRRYIIFPEGGYYHNRNAVMDFMPGSFKCAVRAKCPIVPVAIIDSYKPFEINSLKKVTTQVYFLDAIKYDIYKGMTTEEIAKLVKGRIVQKMENVLEKK